MNPRKAVRPLLLTIYYVLLCGGALGVALWLRFDGNVEPDVGAAARAVLLPFVALSIAGFAFSGLYRSLWRYAGTDTLVQIARGVTISALALLALRFASSARALPLSVVPMVWMLELLALGASRVLWRSGRERAARTGAAPPRRTLVLGATPAGVRLIQDMRRHAIGPERLAPAGLLDDDPRLMGREVEGVRVLGTLADLPRVLAQTRASMVLITDPELPARGVREIAAQCAAAGAALKTVPAPVAVERGAPLARLRDVRIEDLLGRQAVKIELGEVSELVRGQCVLVTGAGGSIGSELARQVAALAPAALVLLDRAENGLYYVQREIAQARPALALHAVVGDIRDPEGTARLFAQHRPSLVLHAAAHKHVPLLEEHPAEAVLNNVIGTRVLMECAEQHSAAKLVLISTDKAVHPASVMGASKRLCEMMLQARARRSTTRFVAVRFGNVLGSEGSVIPLFQRQIASGGPLTVTDAEAMRYFMTIEESVRLVLQAAAMGAGGEVYLLDMGEPVRILDLARQLIQLAGLSEGEDIEIVFTGLRPGEKLREELYSADEHARPTRHPHILSWDLAPADDAALAQGIADLERAARAGDAAAIRAGLHRLVPEYVER